MTDQTNNQNNNGQDKTDETKEQNDQANKLPDDIEAKMKKLEEKVDELENNWKRAMADYINFKKRTEEEKSAIIDFANAVLLGRFLLILDNLEMLDNHINDESLKLILKDFKQILTDEGVNEIEALGKEFNPEQMDAIETVEGEKNKVVEVTQKGYTIKDKLLRPARVKVGKG